MTLPEGGAVTRPAVPRRVSAARIRTPVDAVGFLAVAASVVGALLVAVGPLVLVAIVTALRIGPWWVRGSTEKPTEPESAEA